LSKSCQKVIKKLLKGCQKVIKTLGKKLPKSCQKDVKKMANFKIGCKMTKILKRVGGGGEGEGDL
jgi:hypothetical protein